MTGEQRPRADGPVADLLADGFTLVEDLALREDLPVVWPAEHHRAVPETRAEPPVAWPDGACHLVRSPWPGLTAHDVAGLLVAWLRERDPAWAQWASDDDHARRLLLERDFFVAFDATFREEWDQHLKEWM